MVVRVQASLPMESGNLTLESSALLVAQPALAKEMITSLPMPAVVTVISYCFIAQCPLEG